MRSLLPAPAGMGQGVRVLSGVCPGCWLVWVMFRVCWSVGFAAVCGALCVYICGTGSQCFLGLGVCLCACGWWGSSTPS